MRKAGPISPAPVQTFLARRLGPPRVSHPALCTGWQHSKFGTSTMSRRDGQFVRSWSLSKTRQRRTLNARNPVMWFIHTLGMTAVEAQLSHTTQFPVDRSRHGYGLRRGSPLAAVPPRWCGPDLSGAAGNPPGRSDGQYQGEPIGARGYTPAAPRRTQDLRGARAHRSTCGVGGCATASPLIPIPRPLHQLCTSSAPRSGGSASSCMPGTPQARCHRK
jgi:hypothetical protein